MAAVPIFHAHVSAEGRLEFAAAETSLRRAHLQTLLDRDVEVIVRKVRTQRSLDMNAYWHAVPFPILADYWGEDIETAKLLILGECFGWRETRDGHRIPVKPSSSALTVEEGSHLTNWIPPWAMVQFGVLIPLPNEAAA